MYAGIEPAQNAACDLRSGKLLLVQYTDERRRSKPLLKSDGKHLGRETVPKQQLGNDADHTRSADTGRWLSQTVDRWNDGIIEALLGSDEACRIDRTGGRRGRVAGVAGALTKLVGASNLLS